MTDPRFEAALQAAAIAFYGNHVPFDRLAFQVRTSLARAVVQILYAADAAERGEIARLEKENAELTDLVCIAKTGLAELNAMIDEMQAGRDPGSVPHVTSDLTPPRGPIDNVTL